MRNERKFTIEIDPSVFPSGEHARISIKNLKHQASRIGWAISLVGEGYTTFAMASSGSVDELDEYGTSCHQFENLKPGLYLVSRIELQEEDGTVIRRLEPSDYGVCLFEIYEPDSKNHSDTDLMTKFERIIARRESEYLSGIGDGESEYAALIFLKDILITNRIRLSRYELIPSDGLSCQDELQVMQGYLENIGQPALGNTEGILERARQGQPTLVVHFPKVMAESIEHAGKLVEYEADLLVALLSMQRGGAGEVFASLIYDMKQQKPFYRIHTPHYGGNLLGGWLSGEDPRTIVRRMETLRKSEMPVLYVSLFREALREPNLEFQFFRYWNILETIARNKDFSGRLMRDWKGSVVKNRRGDDRRIQDTAEEMVFELIREKLTPKFGEMSFASGLNQGSISDQIRIWYRRRNCVVHGSECLCRDPSLHLWDDPKYANCKSARDEISSQTEDGYLRTLREVTEIVISTELA